MSVRAWEVVLVVPRTCCRLATRVHSTSLRLTNWEGTTNDGLR